MNCRDYEHLWNDRLDARDSVAQDIVGAMDNHTANCPACQAFGAKYQVLVLSLRSLGPIPGPSAGFVDRVLAAEGAAPEVVGHLTGRRLAALATAAGLVLAITLALTRFGIPGRAVPEGPALQVRAIDETDLSEALADASSATWELALEASAPAARVGRQVLGSARIPDAGAGPELSLAEGLFAPADVWQTMEEQVNAGVRPLEGSARRAFGFLIGVSSETDRPPALPAKGA